MRSIAATSCPIVLSSFSLERRDDESHRIERVGADVHRGPKLKRLFYSPPMRLRLDPIQLVAGTPRVPSGTHALLCRQPELCGLCKQPILSQIRSSKDISGLSA